MKRHILGSIGAAIVLSAFLPSLVIAAPQVFIYTDKGSYQAPETIEFSLGGENYDEPVNVDVYVGLVGHDGALHTLSEAGWGAYLEPWLANVFVPNPYYMAPVPFQWFDIPCAMPPIAEQDEYSFAAGLTVPGTLEFVAEISFAPFTIEDREVHIYVSADTGDDANDGSLESPFKTITHALASVVGSEAHPVTIHVAAGTYAQSTNSETFPLNMESWVSVKGEDRDRTVLDAEGMAYHVIYCDEVENLTIEGFTITGGEAYGDWRESDDSGGGIYCFASAVIIAKNTISGNNAIYGGGICCQRSSPRIEDNTIMDNWATYNGGGICCLENSSPHIMRNEIIENRCSSKGSGICCLDNSSPIISGNTIMDNIMARLGSGICCSGSSSPAIIDNTIAGNIGTHGAGICCYDHSSPTVIDCTIENNMVAKDGGGILCSEGSSPFISSCSISHNISMYGCGGGICCHRSSPIISDTTMGGNLARVLGGGIFVNHSSPALSNSVITNNRADFGGGISCWDHSSPTITNCLLTANTADSGAAIYCLDSSFPAFSNCTIADNVAACQAGGIFAELNCQVEVLNSILWGGAGIFFRDNSCVSVTYSCVQSLFTGDGNIHDDPMFTSGPYSDYYLDPSSLCIDAGSILADEAGLGDRTTQADGSPDTGRVDVGYHHPIQ